MKYIANGISIARMVLSICLIFLYKKPVIFIIVYILCGLSDVLDGVIARKTNSQSVIGAKLDSVGDVLLFGVITALMVTWAAEKLTIYLPLLLIILLIRGISITIGLLKYHTFISIHTIANKVTGLLLFIAPILFILLRDIRVILPVGIIAIVSAVEESVIILTSDKADLNRRSIFKKQNE